MPNEARCQMFAGSYAAEIVVAMRKAPGQWRDTPETAHALATKMTAGLASGTAHLSAQGKAAARALKIKPTARAIHAWLNSTDTDTVSTI